MNKLAGVLFVVGTLFVLSDNFKVIAVFFYAASFLSFLSSLAGSSIEEQKEHTASMKKGATSRFNASERKKDRYVKDDSHLTATLAGVGIAASILGDDDSSLINDDDINGINSISNTFDETEDMIVNPASGLLMIGGILGGVDAGGNVYGSDSMSDMHNSMDNSSMFSDDLISTTDSFDSFGSSSSIDDSFGMDDSFSSFDDSFSSMDDDW